MEARGPRRFLWAGVTVAGFEAGRGCHCLELFTGQDQWTHLQRGWAGGSCLRIGFLESRVAVATQNGGVLLLDPSSLATAEWHGVVVNCGLPMEDTSRFQQLPALAVDPGGRQIMAGGESGLFRTNDAGATFRTCGQREFTDQVTLPETWLFCSGEHELNIVSEDEANPD